MTTRARWKDYVAGAGVLLGGAAAGALAEELLFRRVVGGSARSARVPAMPDPIDVKAPDGTRLSVYDFGPPGAPACVFAHGVLNSSLVWHKQLSALGGRPGLRVLAYDARGHGTSGEGSGPDGAATVDTRVLAADLMAVLDGAGVDACVLAGHSMGGMTVLQAAADHTSQLRTRIRGLAIVNSTADVAGLLGPAAAFVARVPVEAKARLAARRPSWLRPYDSDLVTLACRLAFGERPSRDDLLLVGSMVARTPGPTLLTNLDAVTFDVSGRLPDIDVPALVVAGSRDVLTPPFMSRRMAEAMPRARLTMMRGAGHMTPLERAAELNALLSAFVDETLDGALGGRS